MIKPGDIPAHVVALCRNLRDAEASAYVVGGAVRDLVLGRPVSDWDVATSAHPKAVQRCFRRTVATGIKHGTITVLCPDGRSVEVTTFRGEGAYSDGRRPDAVDFVDDVVDDLSRRDFTINAMAYDPIEDQLVDPFDGEVDLGQQLIRAVGDPADRLGEDGLRSMRAVRFAAVLGFEIEGQTKAAIAGSVASFRKVSAERVRDELLKLLDAPKPSTGLVLMAETGLLQLVLSEVSNDRLDAALSVVDVLPKGQILRLAGVLSAGLETDPTSAQTDDASKAAEAIGHRLRLSNRQRRRLVWLMDHVTFGIQALDAKAARRFLHWAGSESVGELFALRLANHRCEGQTDSVQRVEAFLAVVKETLATRPPLTLRQLAIKGADVIEQLDCGPGPHVGEMLEALLEHVLDDPSLNDRERLLSLVLGKWTGPRS